MTDPPRRLSSVEGKVAINARRETESRDDVVARLRAIGERRFQVDGPADGVVSSLDPTPDTPEPEDLKPVVFQSKGRTASDRADTRRFQRESIAGQQQVVDGIMALVDLAQADDRENARRHRQTLVAAWIAAIAGIGSIIVGLR